MFLSFILKKVTVTIWILPYFFGAGAGFEICLEPEPENQRPSPATLRKSLHFYREKASFLKRKVYKKCFFLLRTSKKDVLFENFVFLKRNCWHPYLKKSFFKKTANMWILLFFTWLPGKGHRIGLGEGGAFPPSPPLPPISISTLVRQVLILLLLKRYRPSAGGGGADFIKGGGGCPHGGGGRPLRPPPAHAIGTKYSYIP